MAVAAINLNIVSTNEMLFSGLVKSVQVRAEEGEMGVYLGHIPLLTTIKPGLVKLVKNNEEVEAFYLSGGILEVQPDNVNILADVAIRGEELDKQAALKAKSEAENMIKDGALFDKGVAALEQAVAQLRVIEFIKDIRKN